MSKIKVDDYEEAIEALENIQTFSNDRDEINNFMDYQLDDVIYEIKAYVEALETEIDSLNQEVEDLQDKIEEAEGNNA